MTFFKKIGWAALIASFVASLLAPLPIFLYLLGSLLWFLKSGDLVWLTAMDINFLVPYLVNIHTEMLTQSWIGLAAVIRWVASLPIIISGPIALWFLVFLLYFAFFLIARPLLRFRFWIEKDKTDDSKDWW